MELVINDFGTFIGKKENLFEIKKKDSKEEYSADKVDRIKIISSASISSKAIELAVENNIDIVLTNYFGKPYARIYPCKLGGTTLTRRRQLEACKEKKGVIISKQNVVGKLQNQLNLIKSLSKTREGIFKEEIKLLEKNIFRLKKKDYLSIDEAREELLGFEGYSASVYFSCLSKILPFEKREHEAKDIVNIALNYGYGILYSEIERACIVAGLDPYLGFLHTDRYGKPSLVLDLIEPFRQFIVDRAIINMFVQKQLSEGDLEDFEGNKILKKEGREKVISAVLERLHLELKYNSRKLQLKTIIQDKMRELVRFLLDEQESYEPFIFRN